MQLHVHGRAGACRRALVSASCTIRYAASSTPGSRVAGVPWMISRVPAPDASRASSSSS
ncbi:hypothetical protein ACFQX7_30705 [Luedemannella flava]